MGAVLTVESEEAARLADELAALRGLPVADAVTEALRAVVEREREIAEKYARIMELAGQLQATMRDPLPTSDHDWLYDENGLPA